MSLNFRSSLRGFNRQDVARYLEYLNNQHTAQLNQLNTDLENLRRKAEAQEESGRIQELEAKNAELEERIQALIKERDEALRRRDEDQRLAEVQLSGARMDSSQELEAYRRAERAERVARERANLVYAQTGAVLNQASNRVEGAIRQVTGISQQVSSQLDTLQAASSASRLALQDAADTINRLKPKQE